MSKIQSQAGNSLADVYDVQGSIAGIDTLETRELSIFHEMGSTVFSERFATTFRRLVSGAVAQDTDINVVLTNLPGAVTRLLGVVVFSDDASRISNLTLLVRDPAAGQDIPLWVFAAGTSERSAFFDDNAGSTFDVLLPSPATVFVPTFIGGSAQANPNMVQDFAMRGRTTGFGAGTVFVRAILYFAFPFVLGTRSRGLPIPSW